MGKLDKNRMSNATKVSRVDNAHNATEQDVGEILGIPDNTQITNPVLGTTPSGGKSVQPDGSIRGTPILKMSAATSNPANAIGFEFRDGTKVKKIAFTDSGLKIWENDNGSWTQISDLENPENGAGTFLALSDVTDDSYTGKGGYLVKVNVGGTALELVAPTAGSGITRLVDASDYIPGPYNGTPFNPADAGKILAVQSSSGLALVDAPTGVGDPFVMWLEAVATGAGWGRNSWIEIYNLAYTSVADDGGFLTTDASLLTNDGLDANKFVTLAAGVYNIEMWYYTSSSNKTGVRDWRVANATGYSDAVGPATVGVEQPGHFFFSASTAAGALNGIHSMGSRQLIMKAGPSKIYFEVRQTSTTVLQGVTFFATITKVK